MAETTERKVALLTGITGQDGSYLAEFLLEKGYTVSNVIELSIWMKLSEPRDLLVVLPYDF